ncbi:MAG: hypothetical protein U0Q07_14910 [Acidimicrobiales bacterium]
MSPPRRPRLHAAAVCAPGLEAVTAAELTALGVAPGRAARGLVPFSTTVRNLYAANLWLRTATRVVVRIATFESRDLDAFAARARGVPWEPWLAPGVPVRFRVTTHACRLNHTTALAERLARAAGVDLAAAEAPGEPPVDDDDGLPPPLVVVRGVHDRFTISVDSSGAPLHRRGWRRAVAKAPLRPTVAAALLLASGWDPATPLVDPFCGSGTITIEAARLARRLPPATERAFAFEAWPDVEHGTWASVRGEARSRALDHAPAPILGRDRDEGAVAAATGNAERAEVTADVAFAVAAVSDLEPPAPRSTGSEPEPVDGPSPRATTEATGEATGDDRRAAWIVTNPPWGGRVAGGGDLRNLYARFGTVARKRLTGGRVVLLAADPVLAGHTGLRLTELFATDSGGVAVQALTAPLDPPGRSPRPTRPSSPGTPRRSRRGAGTPPGDR